MTSNILKSLAPLMVIAASSHAFAQDESDEVVPIVVTGQPADEAVESLGKAITRPVRAGQPVARFDDPVCIKVSGLPDGMAQLVKERIESNIGTVRGVEIGAADCKPNAFVGVLNDVTKTVDKLRKDEDWLFEGLLDYQVERIYKGSDAVRAWHVFDLRNLDGSQIPGKQRGAGDSSSIASAVNQVEKASRVSQLRNNLVGAVVLIETGALKDRTFRQLADYATIRILASISDEIGEEADYLPTILTLFNGENPPVELTEFDRAYLHALYELPANSRDGQVIAAATSRYLAELRKPLDE